MTTDPITSLAVGDGLELYHADLVDGGRLRAGVLVRSPTDMRIVLTVDGGDTPDLGQAEADELAASLAVAMARLRVLNHRLAPRSRVTVSVGELLALAIVVADKRVRCVVTLLADGSEFAFPASDIPRASVALGAIEDRISAVALAAMERPEGVPLN